MQEIEKELWRKVKKYMRFLKIVPFLRMAAVCNNLAFGKVDKESDIDIFIVAKSGRLFTVRFLVTLILQLCGVRRHENKIVGRFCLSFFVDDEFLDFGKIAIYRDIYLAYWLKTLAPVLDDGVSKILLGRNAWIKKYFENDEKFVLRDEYLLKNKNFVMRFLQWFFGGTFGDFCEKFLKKWQLKRAKKKASLAQAGASLLISEHVLKFHNIDRRHQYRDRWLEKYGENAKIRNDLFLTL